MKVIFMGTPDFAVPCLEMLINEKYNVIGVFTQPDKPKGRGNKVLYTPVKEIALKNNLEVFQPIKLRDSEYVELIRKMKPDVIVVVAYGQILPKEILDIPPYGCINVHASLLPKYRGAAPINWAIIDGEKVTGVTTMYMDVGLDTGDMILKGEIEIGEDETAEELHNRLSILGAKTLKETLEEFKKGNINRTKQNHDESTHTQKISKDLGQIDWTNPAEEIRNLVRGLIPWPTAYTSYKGNMMKIFKARVEKGHTNNPGEIIDVNNKGIFIATGKDILIVEELQFSGGKRLAVKDYLRGNSIDKNIVLGE
ncbi:methionyl-tRNA formyltransferase [Serpentinicella alkaliphila]|uniref:Methionyl-tRNA formyltransferase n=1 Tax=Serpentinicella alkaliphila TaxID=1734049 RepID=A0A4V2T3J7_9FIRM|nr:methionyl-tRNA formyltransferase [Serpentinicella alkaliphila]QUH26214.1 methionyl-tRNA formyltransferase [Serpentinicella alkaliphila]TCQ01674.1 methionyl-tRNA formyltransferase [Serpentinicella alkaliphila]